MRKMSIAFMAIVLIMAINSCKDDGYEGCSIERLNETNNPGYESIDFSYDNEGRVTKAIFTDGSEQSRTEYEYKTDSLIRRRYNAQSQLTSTAAFKLNSGYASTGFEAFTTGESRTYTFAFNGDNQITRSVVVSSTLDTIEDFVYEYNDGNRVKKYGRDLFYSNDSAEVLYYEQYMEYSVIEDHTGFFANTLPVYIPELMGTTCKNLCSKVRTASYIPRASLNNSVNFQGDVGLSGGLARIIARDSSTNFTLYVRDYYYTCD